MRAAPWRRPSPRSRSRPGRTVKPGRRRTPCRLARRQSRLLWSPSLLPNLRTGGVATGGVGVLDRQLLGDEAPADGQLFGLFQGPVRFAEAERFGDRRAAGL